jgi:glycosyltransferase involved in cell wall biosynthesis
LKVLHLEAGTHLYGGATQVLLLVEGLLERGVGNVLVLAQDTPVAEEAHRRGLPVRSLALRGEADLFLPLRLRRLILQHRPDLIHLHSRRGADTLGALAARWTGTPVILSRRVDNPEPDWLVGPKYRLYDGVITISRAIQEVLLSQGVPPEKVRCVPSAVDPGPFTIPCDGEAFLQEFALHRDDRIVGMAAQFIPRKGHDVLLQAIPEVLETHPRTRFLLFGEGPLRKEVEARARREGLEAHVIFPGFREDFPHLLPCLDVFAHPALKEGLGVVLLQASAAGVPIVAARAGGIPEAVREGENGLLVSPGDPSALATAISSLLSDPVRAGGLGEGGRELVRREFSVDRMVQGNLDAYSEILSSSPSPE